MKKLENQPATHKTEKPHYNKGHHYASAQDEAYPMPHDVMGNQMPFPSPGAISDAGGQPIQ